MLHLILKLIVNILLQIIKMLSEKCRNQEAMIAEFESRETEYQDLESESQEIKQEMDSLRWVVCVNVSLSMTHD